MVSHKIIKYNKDNPLHWSETDFRDVICTMCQIKFLNNEPLTPIIACYYMQESEDWKKERLEEL